MNLQNIMGGMGYAHKPHITDEDRREFLKTVGVAGAVTVGGVTLGEIQEEATSNAAVTELAPIGQAIESDLTGTLDAGFIGSQQAELVEAANGLSGVQDRGLPTEGPRAEFMAVAEAGRPLYDHFVETGFFGSTSEHLPAFTPSYLESAVQAFVGAEPSIQALEEVEIARTAGVDLVATVIAQAENLADYNWVAHEELSRDMFEEVAALPDVTMGAAGGALLWLEDLDDHLWRRRLLITDEMLGEAVWHGQSLAAGFHLMSEGARRIAEGSGELSEGELAGLLSTGIAIQEIAQSLLPMDVYWITEEMRAEKTRDIKPITR